MRRVVVEIGFRSGNVLKIKCESFTLSGSVGTANYSYVFKGLTPGDKFSLDLSQAEYVRVTE